MNPDTKLHLRLYLGIAASGYLTTVFGDEEIRGYLNPQVLFWTKTFFGLAAALLLAAKMFFSTSWADEKHAKTNGYGLDTLPKPIEPPKP